MNSMTSLLLRLLENFDGALFITSNRILSVDPAALSRVTLAIHFDQLTNESKQQIWKNSLIRIFSDEIVNGTKRGVEDARRIVEDEFDLVSLGKMNGSGRSIGSIIKLAIALAEGRKVKLSMSVINDAYSVFDQFSSYLNAESDIYQKENW